jgi:hypothetical protein
MRAPTKHIDYSEIDKVIYYKDGQIHWRSNNKVAGTKTKDGYIKVQINNVPYTAHRLAWCLVNKSIPVDKQIDHINRDKSDNRIDNLRLVDNRANALNKKCKGSNTGVRGVTKDRNYYKVSFTIKGKAVHVGNFKCFEQAKEIANKYYQQINNEVFG